MKERVRSIKPYLNGLAKRMVTTIMRDEYVDMVRENRPRTEDRIVWLVNMAVAKALGQYKSTNKEVPLEEYFTNRCGYHAQLYVEKVIRVNEAWLEDRD